MDYKLGGSFSCNIFEELSIDDLKKEYQKNVQVIMDYYYDRKSPLLYVNPIK